MGKNLGKEFENEINKLCEYVNATGGFATKLSAERLYNGTYIAGEPFDYIILTDTYKACFDAKYIAEGDTWKILKKDIMQANNLAKCKHAGLNAFFLLYFKDNGLLEIDIDKVVEALKTRKHIKAYECRESELKKWIEGRKRWLLDE